MSTAAGQPGEEAGRPSWVHWPDRPLPPYAVRLLAEIARRSDGAVPAGHVFCPDGLAVGPAGRVFEHAVVALPGDVWPLGRTTGDERAAHLSEWIRAGASLVVQSRAAAKWLAEGCGADRNCCHVIAFPLPDTTVLPPETASPSDGYILVDRPIWQVLHPYLRALRLASCRRRVVLVAADAGPQLSPGGDVAMVSDLVPNAEVGAVLERGPAVAGAAVIVRFETAIDAGWELRECLSAGRPLVINGEPAVRDHLETVGAAAYLYPGLDFPVQAAEATIAALAHTRGPVQESARRAVLEEDWGGPARALAGLMRSPPFVDTPLRTSTVGTIDDRGGLRIAVIAPPNRVGSAERFLREIVTELARHPSHPSVTLFGSAARMTEAARETESHLAESGGRSIEVGDEGLDNALAANHGGFDVVWCTWPHRELPPQTDAPVVTTLHDLHWRFFWSLSAQVIGEIEEQMPVWLERSTLFVSSSEFIRGQLCDQYSLTGAHTRVVPLTGMRPLPVSQAASEAVRKRFCLPHRFLLFPGSRAPHKNHVALVRALEILRAEGNPLTVVTTSESTDVWFHGPDMLGIGYVTDDTLRALYELCDGLVTPTLYEAGSFPVFEAMMVGKPVACSRIPPLVEQLERDGAEAELFDPNDPDDIAAALKRLRGMGPVKRARLVRHNRIAVGRRSWADVADGYMTVFSEAIAAQASVALPAGEP